MPLIMLRASRKTNLRDVTAPRIALMLTGVCVCSMLFDMVVTVAARIRHRGAAMAWHESFNNRCVPQQQHSSPTFAWFMLPPRTCRCLSRLPRIGLDVMTSYYCAPMTGHCRYHLPDRAIAAGARCILPS